MRRNGPQEVVSELNAVYGRCGFPVYTLSLAILKPSLKTERCFVPRMRGWRNACSNELVKKEGGWLLEERYARVMKKKQSRLPYEGFRSKTFFDEKYNFALDKSVHGRRILASEV